MRVLLVEDSLRLGRLLCEGLREDGHTVDLVGTAREFKNATAVPSHDVYVIDLGLPDGDGLQLINDTRAASNSKPILVITARASISDRVSALDCGADDLASAPRRDGGHAVERVDEGIGHVDHDALRAHQFPA